MTSPEAANALASRPSGPRWSITTEVVMTSGTADVSSPLDVRSSPASISPPRTSSPPRRSTPNSGREKTASPCLRSLVATPPTPIPRTRTNRARSLKSTPCRLSHITSAAIWCAEPSPGPGAPSVPNARLSSGEDVDAARAERRRSRKKRHRGRWSDARGARPACALAPAYFELACAGK